MIRGDRVLRTCPRSHESKLGKFTQDKKRIRKTKRGKSSWSYSHESDTFSPRISLDGGVLGEAF